jgi:hypothetical protein
MANREGTRPGLFDLLRLGFSLGSKPNGVAIVGRAEKESHRVLE